MMHSYEYFYNVIIYNLITKIPYTNFFKIPTILKITLHFSFKKFHIENKKKMITILLLLELLSNQKPLLTKSRKNILTLKIKKNMIIGCKVDLRKNRIFIFIDKLLIFILPNFKKQIFLTKNQNILNFKINNLLEFFELKEHFLLFQDIEKMDISIITNSNKFNNELFIFFNEYLFKNIQLKL